MAPTLRPGQLVLTRKLGRHGRVRRRDVVIADNDELGRAVIKRVIGLPGERVSIEAGRVLIDESPLSEPYGSRSVFSGTFEVPAGHYLLLGDNRDQSVDSRTWARPYIAREALRGRLILKEGRATAISRRG